jgi:hypothetical protein
MASAVACEIGAAEAVSAAITTVVKMIKKRVLDM